MLLEGMRLSRNWAAAPWGASSRRATLPSAASSPSRPSIPRRLKALKARSIARDSIARRERRAFWRIPELCLSSTWARHDGAPFLVMEFVEGRNLAEADEERRALHARSRVRDRPADRRRAWLCAPPGRDSSRHQAGQHSDDLARGLRQRAAAHHRFRHRQAGGKRDYDRPASCWARPRTCRPSSSPARPSTAAPTCFRWA